MEKLIVISSYPEQGKTHGKQTVGVASYAKNTLKALNRGTGKKLKIIVLAEKSNGQTEKYQEGPIAVIRCWQRNSWLAGLQILNQARKIDSKKVLFEFEMAMLGNPLKNILIPPLLLILKLMKKRVIVVIHQVLLDFDQMNGHIGERKRSLKAKALSVLAKVFYRLVGEISDQVIVFEKFLKRGLSRVIATQKIIVVPHGVEDRRGKVNRKSARKKLGLFPKDFVIMLFGFLSWYKGTDWLIKTVIHSLNKNGNGQVKLLIVGGPNPNYLDKKFYQKYIRQIECNAQKHPEKINVTGFIDEKEIDTYYQAADALVFPYRVSMSSSGPLALTFTNQRPFMISKNLLSLLKTKDIAENMRRIGINNERISFSLKNGDFWNKLTKLRKDENLRSKLIRLGQRIATTRSWEKVGKMYQEALFPNHET